jgi:hypothetical protein
MAEVNDGIAIVSDFVTEKDTPGTRKFKEVHEGGRAPIGSLYITKEFLDKIGNPTTITVTVSAS